MAKFVTGLFESEIEAARAIEALEEAGYRGDSIRNIEGEGEPWSGVFRVDREVMEYYARRIPEGLSLVVVVCRDQEGGEVERILQRFEVADPEEMVASMVAEAEGAAPTGRWFETVEIKEEEWVEREGAKAHAVHVGPKKGLDRVGVADLPGSEQHSIFERLEPEFRGHYRRELSDSRYSYEEMALAYRFGVQLAENRRFRDQSWSEVEGHARKSWEGMEEIDWTLASLAIGYGWERVPRGKEERRSR